MPKRMRKMMFGYKIKAMFGYKIKPIRKMMFGYKVKAMRKGMHKLYARECAR